MRAIYDNNCCVSTQVLNELTNVLLKWKMSKKIIEQAIDEICLTCEVKIINEATIKRGLTINERYGYSFYDSLILAAALEANCEKVFSEDMQDGQVIDGKLTIINIFNR